VSGGKVREKTRPTHLITSILLLVVVLLTVALLAISAIILLTGCEGLGARSKARSSWSKGGCLSIYIEALSLACEPLLLFFPIVGHVCGRGCGGGCVIVGGVTVFEPRQFGWGGVIKLFEGNSALASRLGPRIRVESREEKNNALVEQRVGVKRK